MTAWFVTALRQGSARIFTATFLFFTLSAALMAQSQSGGLRGQVLDPTGAVIPNADITLKGEAGQTVSAKSDGIGSYAIKNLPAGKYTMTVQEKGFRPNVQDLQVAAGQEHKLNITLEVYVEEEHVDVQSDAAKISVNPENNASSLVISGKDLDALSDDPDELQSELQALAGPSAGPNGGQIYIDGFTGGQLPPKASIREVRINQNPFSAEYDRMGYGRIEVFTKPGTDKMHGQFFYNDNHSIFDSANPFGAIEPSFSTQLYNGNVGGPINKKASYFFNVERRDINDAAVVPAASFADAGQTPVPVLNPRVRTNFSGRIDYQLTGNNTLTARYQFTHDDQKNNGIGGSFQPALPSQAFNETNTEHTIQISDTQILSARVVNETRFEWQRGNANQNSLTLTPAISVLGDFSGGGNPLGISDVTSTHYELQNYTSVNLGTHFFRFGGRLRATHQDNSSTQNFNGTFTFASLANFQAGQPNQLIIASGNPLVSNTYVDGGLYGEDDWKLRQNMTLSYGLRFETQNGIQDRADWAPRIGFAWGLGGKKNAAPKTVIRAGFGIFYDRFDQDLIMNAERLNGINQQRFTLNNSTPANQSLLNTLFTQFPTIPAVAGLTAVPSTTYSISPELTAPYAVQQAASVERQVTKTATATVTYLHSHGVHQLFSINTNALTPGAPPAYQYVSEGVFNQNEMIANFMVRAGAKLTLFSYYVLNYANSDSNGAGTFPSNPALGITADYGRAAFDVHNRAFFGGSVALPKGFRIFPFMVVNSGSPYNITTGSDLNGDSIFNDRPAFATGASAVDPLSPQATDFNVNPGPNDPRIPINFGQGPGQFTFNMRLSKTFGLGPKLEAAGDQNQQGGRGGPVFGGAGRGPRGGGGGRGPGGPFGERSNQRYSLTLSANARNIFNNVNPAPPIGTLSSPLFGQSTALAGGPFNTQSANRRIDFQVMFAF